MREKTVPGDRVCTLRLSSCFCFFPAPRRLLPMTPWSLLVCSVSLSQELALPDAQADELVVVLLLVLLLVTMMMMAMMMQTCNGNAAFTSGGELLSLTLATHARRQSRGRHTHSHSLSPSSLTLTSGEDA